MIYVKMLDYQQIIVKTAIIYVSIEVYQQAFSCLNCNLP